MPGRRINMNGRSLGLRTGGSLGSCNRSVQEKHKSSNPMAVLLRN